MKKSVLTFVWLAVAACAVAEEKKVAGPDGCRIQVWRARFRMCLLFRNGWPEYTFPPGRKRRKSDGCEDFTPFLTEFCPLEMLKFA